MLVSDRTGDFKYVSEFILKQLWKEKSDFVSPWFPHDECRSPRDQNTWKKYGRLLSGNIWCCYLNNWEYVYVLLKIAVLLSPFFLSLTTRAARCEENKNKNNIYGVLSCDLKNCGWNEDFFTFPPHTTSKRNWIMICVLCTFLKLCFLSQRRSFHVLQ